MKAKILTLAVGLLFAPFSIVQNWFTAILLLVWLVLFPYLLWKNNNGTTAK